MLNKPPITKPITKKVSNIKNNTIPSLNQSEIGLNGYKEHSINKDQKGKVGKQSNKAFSRKIEASKSKDLNTEIDACESEDIEIKSRGSQEFNKEIRVWKSQEFNTEIKVGGYAPFHTSLNRSSNCPPYHLRKSEKSNQGATQRGEPCLSSLPFVHSGTLTYFPASDPIFFQSCGRFGLPNRVKHTYFQPAENQGNKKSVTLAKSFF